MTHLESLFKQISLIVEREKTQQEERRKRGENFNIFNVLGLSTSEVRLHSAFLAELLNPNGDHGLGEKLLQAFINDVVHKNKKSFAFDVRSAKVHVEYDIGTISDNYSEGGRIDLLIQDNNNQTIIIENKIYAGDQHKQLLRYDNYAKKKYKAEQYVLLYLTPEKRDASEDSTGNEDIKYYRICYKEDILNWLEHCVGIAALFPRVRETLTQYITNLKQITNIMSDENKNELIELLKKNMSVAVGILEVEEDIKTEVRRNYVDTVLKRIAKRYDFSINPEYTDFIECKKDSTLVFRSKESHMGVFVLRMHQTSDVFYGIMLCDEKLKGIKVNDEWKNSDEMFPYNGNWMYRYWNKSIEAINIQKEIEMDDAENVEGTIAKEIDNSLKVVKEKNLLEQLDKFVKINPNVISH